MYLVKITMITDRFFLSITELIYKIIEIIITLCIKYNVARKYQNDNVGKNVNSDKGSTV